LEHRIASPPGSTRPRARVSRRAPRPIQPALDWHGPERIVRRRRFGPARVQPRDARCGISTPHPAFLRPPCVCVCVCAFPPGVLAPGARTAAGALRRGHQFQPQQSFTDDRVLAGPQRCSSHPPPSRPRPPLAPFPSLPSFLTPGRPLTAGPAEQCGLVHKGDVLTAVDGACSVCALPSASSMQRCALLVAGRAYSLPFVTILRAQIQTCIP